jgi:hypothetical protein
LKNSIVSEQLYCLNVGIHLSVISINLINFWDKSQLHPFQFHIILCFIVVLIEYRFSYLAKVFTLEFFWIFTNRKFL